MRVQDLNAAYRHRGHKKAQIDPLGMMERPHMPILDLAYHDLSPADLEETFHVGTFHFGSSTAQLRELVEALEQTYCGSIGAEYMHIVDASEQLWVQQRLETVRARPRYTAEQKAMILERLTAAEGLERYLHGRYPGTKRFGLEGGESLIPMLHEALQRLGSHGDLRNKIDCDFGFGVLPVHRLDRETSGVILLACRPRTFCYLAMQFERHKVRKRYIALLHGDLPEPTEEDGWGLWTWPLSKEAGGRLHPEGRPRVVPSETRFRVLRRSAHYTLIECDLLTGRKHQIRRHARLAGHAVVGDARYGTSRSLKFLREETGFVRLALHSFSLQVQLPGAVAPQVL